LRTEKKKDESHPAYQFYDGILRGETLFAPETTPPKYDIGNDRDKLIPAELFFAKIAPGPFPHDIFSEGESVDDDIKK